MVLSKRELDNTRLTTALNILDLYLDFKNTIGNPSAALNSDCGRAQYKPSNPLMFKAIEFSADLESLFNDFNFNDLVERFVEDKIDTAKLSAEDETALIALGQLLIARKLHTYFK